MKNLNYLTIGLCLILLSFIISFYFGYQIGSQIEFKIQDSAIKKESPIKKQRLNVK